MYRFLAAACLCIGVAAAAGPAAPEGGAPSNPSASPASSSNPFKPSGIGQAKPAGPGVPFEQPAPAIAAKPAPKLPFDPRAYADSFGPKKRTYVGKVNNLYLYREEGRPVFVDPRKVELPQPPVPGAPVATAAPLPVPAAPAAPAVPKPAPSVPAPQGAPAK